MKAKLLLGASVGLVSSGAMYFLYGPFATVGEFGVPPRHTWKPQGLLRTAHLKGTDYNGVIPEPDSFHTMHSNLANDDYIHIATAPMFELEWVAETSFFVPEGPTIDRYGNAYFSPLSPKEDVSLVSVDSKGKRRFTIPGRGPAYGAPLILNDKEAGEGQLVYHATGTTAYCIRARDGEIVWEMPTQLPQGEARSHLWGFNYIPQLDALVGVTINGVVFALSRTTGAVLAKPFSLPCAPAKSTEAGKPHFIVEHLGNMETDKAFGKLENGKSVFTSIVDVIFGGGSCVSNYFAVDVHTGKVYIAATASDEKDGTLDGLAETGALYLLELKKATVADKAAEFAILHTAFFPGGTGSTPSLTADSKRVIVSDDQHNVLALSATDLSVIWKVNVGEQIAASIAVGPHNEMYAVTKSNIFKLRETADRASADIVWVADLSDAFPGSTTVNALTPTITANGLAISAAAIVPVGKGPKAAQLVTAVGVGLLDRATGKLRYFAQGREESIAVMVVGSDGSYYTANSPVRRAVSRALWGDRLLPLTGGITKYKPIHPHLVARDGVCAALDLAENAVVYTSTATTTAQQEAYAASLRDDLLHIRALVKQARRVIKGEAGVKAVLESIRLEPRSATLTMELVEKLQNACNLLSLMR